MKNTVIPAKAGTHLPYLASSMMLRRWIPAFAGMTVMKAGGEG